MSSVDIVDTQFVDLSKVLDRNLFLHNCDNIGRNKNVRIVQMTTNLGFPITPL